MVATIKKEVDKRNYNLSKHALIHFNNFYLQQVKASRKKIKTQKIINSNRIDTCKTNCLLELDCDFLKAKKDI